MMNPFFQLINTQNQLFSQFQQFRNAFTGNAQQQVQQMLDSGRITKEQYDQAVNMAKQFGGLFGNNQNIPF